LGEKGDVNVYLHEKIKFERQKEADTTYEIRREVHMYAQKTEHKHAKMHTEIRTDIYTNRKIGHTDTDTDTDRDRYTDIDTKMQSQAQNHRYIYI